LPDEINKILTRISTCGFIQQNESPKESKI